MDNTIHSSVKEMRKRSRQLSCLGPEKTRVVQDLQEDCEKLPRRSCRLTEMREVREQKVQQNYVTIVENGHV